MQELETEVQAEVKCVERGILLTLVASLHDWFGGLEVDVGQLLLPEVVQSHNHHAELVLLKVLVGALDQLAQSGKDPLVSE